MTSTQERINLITERLEAMAVLSLTGNLQKRFLETVLLLRALDEVRGVPTTHGLDSGECLSAHRLDLLKRKFLDYFALVCATHKGGNCVSAVCMEENQPEGTIIRLACNGGVGDSILSNAREILKMLKKLTLESTLGALNLSNSTQ